MNLPGPFFITSGGGRRRSRRSHRSISTKAQQNANLARMSPRSFGAFTVAAVVFVIYASIDTGSITLGLLGTAVVLSTAVYQWARRNSLIAARDSHKSTS